MEKSLSLRPVKHVSTCSFINNLQITILGGDKRVIMITKIKETRLDPQVSLQSATVLLKVVDGLLGASWKGKFPFTPAPQKQKA